MLRMLHMADYITELNGNTTPPKRPILKLMYSWTAFRILRSNVYLLLHALLSRSSFGTRKPMGRFSIYALRAVLRFHGWESRKMAKEEQLDGAGT